ncbi:hypothetical protein K435DRAFT_867056 [Dendrothele bispora CBS 962.96]|uniref:G domain-containing protein n=1 Tax=Dendrothele bispora (strain CBS 962.96) TaxID=1314807 RepID=A0A4S8LGK8_DENBC|nr:hypothetical protein K435DRAFT_867056 [Dendrothele bispora CBS 962.96]
MPKKAQKPRIKRETGILILLMGHTGAGKSSFINTASNRPNTALVNESITSESVEIMHFTIPNPANPSERPIIFVETPGFNHIKVNDFEILRHISEWMSRSCKLDVRVGGIIYFHPINQSRISETNWLLNYLSSPEPVQHLLLTTTKWDGRLTEYEHRERELKHKAWKGLLDRGARTSQFRNDLSPESAWKVINMLLDLEPLELRILKRDLDKICAGNGNTAHNTKPRKGLFSKLFRLFGLVRFSGLVFDSSSC